MTPNRNTEIIAVEVTRTIRFQGPRHWVERTIQQQITDTVRVHVNEEKYIIGSAIIERRDVAVDRNIEADRSIQTHRAELHRGAQERRRAAEVVRG